MNEEKINKIYVVGSTNRYVECEEEDVEIAGEAPLFQVDLNYEYLEAHGKTENDNVWLDKDTFMYYLYLQLEGELDDDSVYYPCYGYDADYMSASPGVDAEHCMIYELRPVPVYSIKVENNDYKLIPIEREETQDKKKDTTKDEIRDKLIKTVLQSCCGDVNAELPASQVIGLITAALI